MSRPVVVVAVCFLAGAQGLLAQSTSAPTSAADSLELAIVILRSAIQNGVTTAYPATLPRLVCVATLDPRADPPPSALPMLASPDSFVIRPQSACRVDSLPSSLTEQPLILDTLTGQRGIEVSASNPTFLQDGSFVVRLYYYEHGLSSAAWTCTGRRVASGWQIESCTLNWVS